MSRIILGHLKSKKKIQSDAAFRGFKTHSEAFRGTAK